MAPSAHRDKYYSFRMTYLLFYKCKIYRACIKYFRIIYNYIYVKEYVKENTFLKNLIYIYYRALGTYPVVVT